MKLFGPLDDAARAPRVGLIHAQVAVIEPLVEAFRIWPEGQVFNLVDDSLGVDLQIGDGIDEAMIARCQALARYAHLAGAEVVMFTTAAFGAAVEACRDAVPVPVLRPTDAVFDEALEIGPRIGLLTTFELAHRALSREFVAHAEAKGKPIELTARCVPEALRALLDRGSPDEHDALLAQAAAGMAGLDALVLGQITMARALPAVTGRITCPVLTSPHSAAKRARDLVMARRTAA